MSEWQPIETCGHEKIPNYPGIIAWNGRVVTAAWFNGAWEDAIDAPDYADNRLDPQPTHWMPFPPPPTNPTGGK